MRAIKLYFKTPVRSGSAGLGLENSDLTIRSDTLFGAIVSALVRMNEDAEEFVEMFKNKEVSVSSCFPFSEDTYFLPNPHSPHSPQHIRKKRFLTKIEFEKLISGDIPEESDENLDFMKKLEVPKVALDRITSNSSIYYLSCVRFRDGAGLYFLVRGRDRMLRVALRYLEDEGLGGKKTWGLGKFEFRTEDFRLRACGDEYITLSLTLPTDLSRIRYWKPVTRSGWINSQYCSLRKPKIIMASEGSIFKEEEAGKLIDLDDVRSELSTKVGYKVYVNGTSFLVETESLAGSVKA